LLLEAIARQTKRVLDAQQPHLGSLDSLPALMAWRDIVQLNKAARGKGCPLGSLASELANESEPARKRLADSFAIWHERIEMGLAKMRERGDIAASADPHELAFALLSAVQGGLLLAKTTHSSRPLEIALDMAIDHVVRQMTAWLPPSQRR
jgi:TetR/AcrR family transcriptional repressor of nem operon